MEIETAARYRSAAQVGGAESPLQALSDIAPAVVPVLYELAERTWPRIKESTRKRFGIVGREERVRVALPIRYRVLLRRFDLATLNPSWRLEAGGPVEFFDWDDSSRVLGSYGFRYSVYSAAPVYDELGRSAGYGVNCRPSIRQDGALSTIDARLDSGVYVRSSDANALNNALLSLVGQPGTDEFRPGMAPTHGYFDVLGKVDRRTYLSTRGVNEYVGPGWTPTTIRSAFDDPSVRALWIADPNGPNATPRPQAH